VLGFDALGDHAEVETVSETEDGLDEGSGRTSGTVVRAMCQLLHKGAIDFDGVDGKPAKVTQG
jgi:hypothetical protein